MEVSNCMDTVEFSQYRSYRLILSRYSSACIVCSDISYARYFSGQFKNCSVHPHLNKSNLDKDDLGNYRPISHLSFLSKTH